MSKKHDKILKIVFEKMQYLNYSECTIDIYVHYINQFLEWVNKYPQHLTAADFQEFLNEFSFTSVSQQNQVINTVKLFYKKILRRKYGKIDFTRPRNEKHLPQIIDKNYLLTSINAIHNIKHKAILMLAFSVGLRVSEVINLKIEDIDSKRMVININQAKGRKDRIVPLSNEVLKTLREYYKLHRPSVYMFNGQKEIQYTATSCNKLVKQYLGEKYHFHLLRHSCFTTLLETGTDLRVIQKIAGHASSRTTEIYTHVTNKTLNRVIIPI